MGEMTVPLVDRGNGLWGSSSPAWDHLINRESSGRPTIIQQIHDVNSGGNEAEGLFQITPATWRSNNGTDFAPTARLATPQQQAIVAARIFTRNPTGSDWGAGRPGRESARDLAAGLVPIGGAPPSRPVEPYGMPTGSNSGGYGGGGVRFPDWVYVLGNAFGLKPSTYPGHQESDRNEGGYAPNPQRLNRGIDWAAPGAPDEVDRMQRFADYLFSIRGELEQVIWWNPQTGKRIGVAGGKDVTTTPYYDYPGGYDDHRDHVHTRQSHSLPLPGGAAPAPVPIALRPQFEERQMFGKGGSKRSRPPMNFFIHTEEGDGTAKSLAEYCQGQNGVSYHYTLRDRIVYDVVDTDLYAWAVLQANVFSINLCFAGSRADFTREQWLQREGDIEIAAYIAVQDCRKYNFSTEVLAPRPGQQGAEIYAGNPRAGISDHNYVTRELGIGDHHDVGPNFPWDRFTFYVNKYANQPTQGDDDLSAEAERMIKEMYDEYSKAKLGPSRSFLATDGKPVESPLGFLYNIDGNVWTQQLTWAYLFEVPLAVEVVESVARNGSYEGTWVESNAFNEWLQEFGQSYCQGLVDFKGALMSKLTSASKSTAAAAPVDTAATPPVTNVTNVVDTRALKAEIARLSDQFERLQVAVTTQPAPSAPASTDVAVADKTPGQIAGGVVDSVTDYTKHLLAMDAAERQGHLAALKALQPANGDQS